MFESIEMNIRYRRCFTQHDPEIPGYHRFYSADKRFPISISCPQWLGPYYDFNREHYLKVEFSSSSDMVLTVAREDLAVSAANGDRRAAAVAAGRLDLFDLMERSMAEKQQLYRKHGLGQEIRSYRVTKKSADFVPVGATGLRAPRATWYTPSKELGGEWVFFQSRRPSVLWMIIWQANDRYDESDFRQILSSFRWEDEAFFQSLPA
ncbi:MAG: hypothetical protein QM692_10210 [Thermomicrobiales bacterium]